MILLLALVGCFVVGDAAWERRLDADGDGWLDPAVAEPGAGDCDDFDPLVGPPVVAWPDADGDGHGDAAGEAPFCRPPEGWVAVGDDCDDADPDRRPGAAEACNGLDDDCDGAIDDEDPDSLLPSESYWFADDDGDGYGTGAPRVRCAPLDGYALADGDCEPLDPTINPGQPELCDTLDNDCDGAVDDDDPDVVGQGVWYVDDDLDGWGDVTRAALRCFAETGYARAPGDCYDADPAVYPGAVERCDHVDNDCDVAVDEDATDRSDWYADPDGDGWGSGASTGFRCFGDGEEAPSDGDCDEARADVNPGATETWYDGVDQDCDGADDFDQDGDGHHAETVGGDDCDDTEPSAYLGATEIWYDGIDQDCRGGNDYDRDGDGVLAAAGGGTDCDDVDPAVRVGAAHIPTDYPGLAEVLPIACANARIEVGPGTYTTNVTISRPVALVGLKGSEQTTLQGSGQPKSVLQLGAGASGTLVDGFTITGGVANAGGGISASAPIGAGAALTLRDLVVRDNLAFQGGGGIRVEGFGVVEISGATVRDNDAGTGGGLSLTDCAKCRLTDVVVRDNTAGFEAAGLHVSGGSAELERVVVHANVIDGPFGGPAGIWFKEGGPYQLTDVSVTDNVATGIGGGISAHNVTALEAERLLLAGNAGFLTGGVHFTGSQAVALRGALLLGNQGAALGASQSALTLAHVTVVGNERPSASPIVQLIETSGAFTDSVVAFNHADGPVYAVLGLDPPTLTRLAFFGNAASDGLTPTWADDPRFMAFDPADPWGSWDLRLGTGSPYRTSAADGTPLGAFGGPGVGWEPLLAE